MTRDQFQQLRTLFEELKSASEEQRSRAIRELEEGDPSLAAEPERMLDAHASGTGPLDHPPVDSFSEELASQKQTGFAIGAQFGPYHLEKELGRGGMGIVYEATRADGSFEKRVAIKILPHDRFDDLFLRRFQ